jgi:DNA polymerase bacteriophage-type
MTVWLDFETRSECNLKAHGAYTYAQHPSTQVLCMAWALDDGEVELWTPDQPFPQAVKDAVQNMETIRAHNAAFERLIFWYVVCPDFDVPEPKLEQFYCTAAQARANCMPGSLEDAGRFAGAGMQKDHKGTALIRKCCVPPFKHSEQDLADLFEYCRQDVRAMRAVSQSIRQLSDIELADYHVNERINDRGVRVDVPLAHAAMGYAAQELRELTDSVRELTEGAVTAIRSPRLREWVLERLGPEARKLAVSWKKGEAKDSLDKTVRANLLAFAEENHDEVPPTVAEVIQATDDVWASSTAKFSKLAALADPEDARVRGAFVFAGGAATGRASSYGAQVHNIPRKAAKRPLDIRDAMMRREALVPTHGKRVTDVLKLMLRPTLVPADGHVFVVADWSAIEGRVNPWLADSPKGRDKLKQFADGLDAYIVNASATFGRAYGAILADHEAGKSDERQIGKVQELSCGFGGGVGAFAAMSRVYGVNLPEPTARRMVQAWRAANQWAPMFWSDLERAYVSAMLHPGSEYSAGRVTYLFDRTHLWYVLPSGRVLCYPYARRERDGSVSYAKASWKPSADAKEWPRGKLWPGLACENVTQATAHDVLREALRVLDGVVLHVHDEVVLEVPEGEADEAAARLVEVMRTPPAWAGGLPLDCECKVMTRYGKG